MLRIFNFRQINLRRYNFAIYNPTFFYLEINKKLLDTTEDDEENIKTRQFVEDILGPELMTTSKCTDDKALRIKGKLKTYYSFVLP